MPKLINSRSAMIYFSEIAWIKMNMIINEFDKEVAWHGVAKRGDDAEKDEYYITDILVYPQEVTGATVNTEQEEYQLWLMSHEDDVFNNIRMQGHSHVNMGTTPSGTDEAFYKKIIDQLGDDMFYIFMIWNKKGEKTIKIYDMAKNMLFETSDCKIEVLDDGIGINEFINEAKTLVKSRVFTTPTYTNNNQSSFSNGGYSSYYSTYGGYYSDKNDKKEDKSSDKKNSTVNKSGKRKGRRAGSMKNVSKTSMTTTLATIADDDDDWNDPYSPFGYLK